MKKRYLASVPLAVFILFSVSIAAPAEKLSTKEILDKIDDLYRSSSSHGSFTMKVSTENWQRELKLEEWSKGKDKSLIRILSPKKEKGTATLRNGNDMWNYLPKVKRVIKLPSSMMSDSWMGSHFTNDDLVKESRMAVDYEFELTFDGKRDGKNIVEITCIPKEDAAVVWGKVVVTVGKPNYFPLEILYYDEDLELARTMVFSNIKTIGGRMLPVEMRIAPTDETDEYTLVTYSEMEFDLELEDKMFSLRNLQK